VTRGPVVVLAWAAWITVLTVVLVVWRPEDEIQWLPFAVASALTWAVGLVLFLRRRLEAGVRLVPDLSPGTTVLVLGLAAVLASPSFGRWLALVGGGVAAVGLVGLVREGWAERRLRR
jgi:glucose uptake protein GlcU